MQEFRSQRGIHFGYIPISNGWRFSLWLGNRANRARVHSGQQSEWENLLNNLIRQKRDFKQDSLKFVKLVESDWEQSVWEILS